MRFHAFFHATVQAQDQDQARPGYRKKGPSICNFLPLLTFLHLPTGSSARRLPPSFLSLLCFPCRVIVVVAVSLHLLANTGRGQQGRGRFLVAAGSCFSAAISFPVYCFCFCGFRGMLCSFLLVRFTFLTFDPRLLLLLLARLFVVLINL